MASMRANLISRVLRLAGFEPQLDHCTGCHAAVHQAGCWSARQGGFLCSSCLHEDPQAEPISPELLDALETLTESEVPAPLEPQLLPLLTHRLEEFLQWRLEHPLKTMKGQGAGDERRGGRRAPAPPLPPPAPPPSCGSPDLS